MRAGAIEPDIAAAGTIKLLTLRHPGRATPERDGIEVIGEVVTRSSEGDSGLRVTRSGSEITQTPKVSAAEEDIRSAREVLRCDRGSRRPWNYVLSHEEEIGLAFLIRGAGIALDEELPEGYCGRLPSDDERAIAFNSFLMHNLRLVWSLSIRNDVDGLEKQDIFHHGLFGLVRAIEKFNATMGYKFSTYATWWIRQSIDRGIANESRLVRLPVHMVERVEKVFRTRERLEMRYGKSGIKDIAAEIGLSVDQVVECLRLSVGVVSLDRPVGGERWGSLRDFLAEDPERITDPAWLVDQAALRNIIDDALKALPQRYSDILKRRAGLDQDDPETLDEIGKVYGLTRERIRQIETKAVELLREELAERGIRPVNPLASTSKPKKRRANRST
jgi:RNA polymerase sigma factor (sigma-70 family)